MYAILREKKGLTLVELMIVLVVTAVVCIGTFTAYSVQSKSHLTQRDVARMQQDLRGALYMIEYDLLNAGRDPFMSNQYGIRDIRYYGYDHAGNGFNSGALDTIMAPPANPLPPFTSYPVIEFSSLRFDTDGDGIGDQNLTIRYQIYDFNDDGRLDLCRRVSNPGSMAVQPPPAPPGEPPLVAEGVIAIGYAFAYDDNRDGSYKLARVGALNSVIWAADTDGDNRLDTNLDTDGDGEITPADDISGDGVINIGDVGAALPSPVDLEAVRAVRIMVLVQSERQSQELSATELDGGGNPNIGRRYAVGNRIIGPFGDQFKRRLQTVVVAMRNFRKL